MQTAPTPSSEALAAEASKERHRTPNAFAGTAIAGLFIIGFVGGIVIGVCTSAAALVVRLVTR